MRQPLFYCRKLPQFTFEKSSQCSCPAFISAMPMPFAFFGDFLSLCLPYTQSHFSTWVYSLIFSSLYPRFFSVLGIHTVFASLYPKFFSVLGIHTVFASLYPKFFSVLGIHTAFCFSIPKHFLRSGYSCCFSFSIPKVFPCPGYISDFCIQYTQTSIFICV